MHNNNTVPVVDFDSINSFIDSELNVLQGNHPSFFSRVKQIFSEQLGPNFKDNRILASSQNATEKDLRRLSVHPALRVRKAVSDNPKTPFDVLLGMYRAKDGSNSYLNPLALALHPNAPDDWIINVASTIDRFHVKDLLHRDELPFEALENIVYKRKDSIFPGDDKICAPCIAGKMLKEKIEKFAVSDMDIFELDNVSRKTNSLIEKMCVALHENVGEETFMQIAQRVGVENPRFFQILKNSSRGDLRNLLNTGSFSYEQGANPKSSYNELVSAIEDEAESKPGIISTFMGKII